MLPGNQEKNLGVQFDRYMICDVHLNELQEKVTCILMYINRIGNFTEKSIRILVIQSLVLRSVYYCI